MGKVVALLLVVVALIGAPLFAVILGGAAAGFYFNDIDLTVLAIELYRLTDSTVLLALPLFTFAGFLLSESKTADRLVNASQAALGWLPGGMVLIGLGTCAFFTMLTGGSGVTIVALGGLLYPALMRSGYPSKFSLGLITTSGSLGLLLPPAIPLLLYGIIAQQMNVPGIPHLHSDDRFVLRGKLTHGYTHHFTVLSCPQHCITAVYEFHLLVQVHDGRQMNNVR